MKLRPQILHAPVALDPVAASAQKLEVVDMIGAALLPGDDVIDQAGSGILRLILNLRPSSGAQCSQTRSSWQVPTVTSLMPTDRISFNSFFQ